MFRQSQKKPEVELEETLYEDYSFRGPKDSQSNRPVIPPIQNLPQGHYATPQVTQQPQQQIEQPLLPNQQFPQGFPNIPGLPPGAQLTIGPNGVQTYSIVTTTTTTTQNKKETKTAEEVTIEALDADEDVGEVVKPPKKSKIQKTFDTFSDPFAFLLQIPFFTVFLMLVQTVYFVRIFDY
jgi:hypothetical protein